MLRALKKTVSFRNIAGIFAVMAVLFTARDAIAQSDILDAIEAELRKEQEAKKAAEKAAKNTEKYELNYRKEIGKADALYKAKKFDESIAAYEAAKQWGPTETYPEEQIKLVKAEKEKAEAEAKIKAIEDAYNVAKIKADAFMASKNYDQAIAAYSDALKSKPDEDYPKSKIAEAQKLKQKAEEEKKAAEEMAKINENFTKKMAEGDAAVKIKKWDEALLHFEEASKLKPAEQMPKARIEQVKKSKDDEEKRLAQEQLQKEYSAAIATADGLLKSKQYDQAIAAYDAAHKLKPAEAYPKTKIAEAEAAKKADEIASTRAEYDKVAKEADALLKSGKYDEAIAKYEEALKILPLENHPKAMIAEAQKLKTQEAHNKVLTEYNRIIADGEALLKTEDFDGAVKKFEEAKKVMPTDKKADELITEAARLKDQKAKNKIETQYLAKLKEGEGLMKSGQFDEAIAAFKEAHLMQPSESKTNELIAESTRLKQEKLNADVLQLFNQKILASETLLKNGQFDEAIAGFKAAHEIMPNETKTRELISQAEKLKSEAANKIKEQEANAMLKEGDELLAANNFAEAERKYQEAKIHFAPLGGTADKKLAALAQARSKQEEQNRLKQKEQAKEEQYQSLMNEAEQAVNTSDFTAAIKALEGALILKPSDKTASDKLKEANALLKKQEQEKLQKQAQEAAAALAAEKETKVSALMAEAKSLAGAQQLYQAKDKLKEALTVIPNHPQAGTQLKDLETQIVAAEKAKAEDLARNEEARKAEAALQEKIKNLLTEGVAALKSGMLDQAEKSFRSVIEADPSQAIASEKIKEIADLRLKKQEEERLKADAAQKAKADAERQARINEMNASGLKALKAGKWDEAILEFNALLAIDALNESAKKGIAEAEKGKADEIAATQEAEAKRKANDEAAQKQQNEKQKQEKINALISEADKLEKTGVYAAALEKYKEVLLIEPTNAAALAQAERLGILIEKQKQEERSKQLSEEKKREGEKAMEAALLTKKAIDDALAEANKKIMAKDYSGAISGLESTLSIYPDAKDVQILLASTKELQRREQEARQNQQQSQLQSKIALLLQEALLAYNTRDYIKAKTNYSEVLKMDATNSEALSGLENVNKAQAQENEEKLKREQELAGMSALQRQIAEIIDAGDDLFSGGKYDEAMKKYQEGLEIDHLNQELKKSIRAAKEALTMQTRIMLAKKAGKPRPRPQFTTDNVTGASGERKDKIKFQNELGKRYPVGVTEEVDEHPRKTITRRIVVKNEIGREFMRIRHNWGGTYYFKDGEATSPFIWQLETRSPDGAN
jgi:tetratricopeptide (TPR) repeat protein